MTRTDRELNADEHRFYRLLETLPLTVYSAEPTPPYAPMYVSRGIEALGYTREQWLEIPDRWIRCIHPDDRDRVLEARARALATGEPLDDEYRMIARDGSVRWVHDRGSFVLDENGKAVEWLGILLDVTERKHAELRVLESEERYRHLIESAPQQELNRTLALLEATIESTTDGLLVVDLEGHIVRMNRKFVELWRIPDDILATRDDAKALAFVLDQLEEPDAFIRKVQELYAKPEAESFDTLRFKDGRVYERASKPQRLNGETQGRVWSFRDVTSQLELEAQVRQSQKMEAIGSLAGGVAHDFNNILTVIRGHVELMLADDRVPADHRSDLAQVYGAAERAMTLTKQLLAFSRKQIMRPVVHDLGQVVRELEPMLRRLIGEDITIDDQISAGTHVLADRAQVEQVLLNLVVNARDAMPKGGVISVRVTNVELQGERRIPQGATIPSGRFVSLAVQDTGIGIEPENLDRVFEPFFTTKEAGKGTGLGLATVYGIVKQSNGFVEVKSEVGSGTTVEILFPAALDLPVSRQSTEFPAVAHGSETVLVVEDESAVRYLTQRALTQHGYTILVAGGAEEALEIARQSAASIDLVLTDVVMPGMGGPRLVEELKRLGVTAPVLYMSGYTDDEIIRSGLTRSAVHFLHKPFTMSELTAAVKKSLRAAKKARRD